MIAQKVLAAVIFGFGLAVFVVPPVLHIGWAVDAVGIALGVALGAMAGAMWQLANEAQRQLEASEPAADADNQ
jgi:hypothetical protein